MPTPTLPITELTRMAQEVTRYQEKVWGSCITAQKYQKDVGALLGRIKMLSQALEDAKRRIEDIYYEGEPDDLQVSLWKIKEIIDKALEEEMQ